MLGAAFREYGSADVLRWEELPDPVLAPDDVIVEVHACGINHCDLDSRAGTSRWDLPLPHVLGAEFSGYIADVGAAVDNYNVGQAVTAFQQYSCGHCQACIGWRQDLCQKFTVFGTDCWGGYAEFVRVPARALIPLSGPEDFLVAAAAQCVVSTAWNLVTALARVRPGETVLVPSASGGVASAAVQCAKIAGAKVIATVGNPEKVQAVKQLGADDVFCYNENEVTDAVKELTHGRGVDAVIDTVGGQLFAQHMEAMRFDGRLATCGAHAGEVVDLDIINLFRRGHSILGFRIASPNEIRQSLTMALQGQIAVPIAKTFPLESASSAHEFIDERIHVGKVVLVHHGT